jgi:hypothetical protein
MHIHGYTDDKKVLGASLSIEEIAWQHLDPWRLDLFDANPVKLTVKTDKGKKAALNFRRLTDISFSYLLDDRLYICLDNGSDKVCLSVDSRTNSGLIVSELPFSTHYGRYLEQFCGLNKGWDSPTPRRRNR